MFSFPEMVGMFAMGFEDYLFAGLLPDISSSLHTSIVAAAQGCAAFGIAYIASIPLCIFLLSKKSSREVLILALFIFIAGNVLTLFSTHLILYIGSRFVAGVGGGLFLPVAVAAAAQRVAPSFHGRALSKMWGANSAGAVIGVPAGLWLAQKMGWRVTVILIIILAAIALLGIVFRKQISSAATPPPSLKAQFSLLLDRQILAVISVTLITATGCLGLYVYISQVLSGTQNSPDIAFSLWSIGGLNGSMAIGALLDHIRKPQRMMTMILSVLFLMMISIPWLSSIPVFGFLPFLIWGALGWASVTPQQYRLIQMMPGHEAILVSLNSSAVSLGSVIGTVLGGLALASGFAARELPYLTAIFVFCALMIQVVFMLLDPQDAIKAKQI